MKSFTLIVSLLLCTSLTMAEETELFQSAQYGETWPFTVDNGTASCHEGKAVVFTSGGKQYALNGVAEIRGYQKLDSIWKTSLAKVELIKNIAEAKKMSPEQTKIFMDPPPKMDIGPLIKEGLRLCP